MLLLLLYSDIPCHSKLYLSSLITGKPTGLQISQLSPLGIETLSQGTVAPYTLFPFGIVGVDV